MKESGFFVGFSENAKGFKMKFENGYLISVIFGDSANSGEIIESKLSNKTEFFSKTAEVAVISPSGELIPFMNDHMVKTKVEPKHIPQIISWAMNR